MSAERQRNVKAIIAEFDSPAELLRAAEKVRDAGFKHFDSHSPFPIHGMDKAAGQQRSPVGFIVGIAALITLAVVAYLLWQITTVEYLMVISGKPYFSYQAYVPVAFAVTVLMSAITATFSMLVLNRLPQLFNPLFESANFNRVTDDGFFISIDARDPKFDVVQTESFLGEIGGRNIEIVEVR